ncbi:MAG TPA: VWA domain-containing protein [Vicinamibacterales bacterium]|nr:VWA domain-containing protein [Vicinamibacterales bacterium]
MRARRAFVVSVLLIAAQLAAGAQRGGGGGAGGRGGGGGGRIGGPPVTNPGPQPDQPDGSRRGNDQAVFRGGVTLVQVDAYVTDAEGKPVTDLKAEDFEVLEGGKPREVTTFVAVSIPIDPPVGLPAEDSALPDTASNEKPPSRTYLFALDEVAGDRALRTRVFLRRFIEKYLGPNDVAAVALTGRGLANSGQDFTNNRRLLLNAIDRFSGGFAEFDPKSRAGSDAVNLAASLRKLTEFLATMPGRKSLIYVGEGLADIDFFNLLDYKGTSLTPAGYDAHAALAAATRGNVTIYPVDPRGLTTELTEAESFSTASLDNKADFAALAQATGGFSFTDSNNVGMAFERIVRENSVYYTLGFNSEYERRDGRFVPLQVRVKRPGLEVKSRAGYVAPIGQERRPQRVAGDTRLQAVADSIASPVATSGVPLRVVATPFRSGRNASIALSVDVDIATVGLVNKGGTLSANLEVEYLATDDRGKVHPGRRHAATVSLKQEALEKARADGVRIISAFELPRGRYQLRVAAGGALLAGSVVYDLEVPDFGKEPLTMSGVSLTSIAASAVTTLRPLDPLADVLPGPPTPQREFSSSDALALFVEVYDNTNRNGKAAGPIELVTELRGEGGRVIRLNELEKEASAATRKLSGGYGFTADFDLNDVPPGPYVLHVEARADRDGPRVVSRNIPIKVR